MYDFSFVSDIALFLDFYCHVGRKNGWDIFDVTIERFFVIFIQMSDDLFVYCNIQMTFKDFCLKKFNKRGIFNWNCSPFIENKRIFFEMYFCNVNLGLLNWKLFEISKKNFSTFRKFIKFHITCIYDMRLIQNKQKYEKNLFNQRTSVQLLYFLFKFSS